MNYTHPGWTSTFCLPRPVRVKMWLLLHSRRHWATGTLTVTARSVLPHEQVPADVKPTRTIQLRTFNSNLYSSPGDRRQLFSVSLCPLQTSGAHVPTSPLQVGALRFCHPPGPALCSAHMFMVARWRKAGLPLAFCPQGCSKMIFGCTGVLQLGAAACKVHLRQASCQPLSPASRGPWPQVPGCLFLGVLYSVLGPVFLLAFLPLSFPPWFLTFPSCTLCSRAPRVENA